MRNIITVRVLKYLVVAGLVVVFVYLTALTVRVTSGVTQTVPVPKYSVRLRILDAGGGDMQSVAGRLQELAGADLGIRVVETATFEVRELARSFVISHEADRMAARLLAGQIGLDPSEVMFEPLKPNYTQASATLVVGLDFEECVLKELEDREM